MAAESKRPDVGSSTGLTWRSPTICLGDDLVLRVNKAGVQVFGVVLENARKELTAKQLLELKTEKSDLVVSIGPRADTVANVGFALGRVASKLIKATREKMNKP